jgi:L-lactate dehydrogenase complex protein LldF
MEVNSRDFLDAASRELQDAARVERRDALALFTPLLRDAAMGEFEAFEELRRHVKQIRQHTLNHLDHYLGQFEQAALQNGNQVHFARDGEELNNIVLDICQQQEAQLITKGKSMVSEETGLGQALERAGFDVMETDLGEYIIQQAGETPSHIVGPALHKSRAEIRQLFLDKHDLGERELADAPDLVQEATLDRILPRAEDASAMLRLLVRSATGQAQTCYTSFYSGPAREQDTDGPMQTHIVLLDNRRSDILASDYREMLQCIRCGACLNHCPVYSAAGGHAYGSVYSGPMGSVLTPLLSSLEESHLLPNACTTCGRCAEVCPADIPLPDLLRDLRHVEVQEKLSSGRWRTGMKLHTWLARQPRLYQALTGLGIRVLNFLGRRRGVLSRLPGAGGWMSQREFPAPQRGTFMQQYARLQADEQSEADS